MQEAAMYEQSDCFDPSMIIPEGADGSSFSYQHHQIMEEFELHQHLVFNNHHLLNQSVAQDPNQLVLPYDHVVLNVHDEDHNHHHHQLLGDHETQNPGDTPPNLLNLFRLPDDTLFHLNFPPQPPLLTDLFHGYNLPGPTFFGGDNHNQDVDNGVLEFGRIGQGIRDPANGKIAKHFTSERQRRVHWNEKYKALRSLIPNPTKVDRASIVGDAIDYIKELLRSVNELKILVDKKRCVRDRRKRPKTEEDVHGDHNAEQSSPYNSSLRSSWLRRKSKGTEVDVRIIDDEVTIKLVQRKIHSLLFVSKLLDALQMDLQHVAGGHIGDYYSFLFNSKIHEGSSVYASAIANKLIEVIDAQPPLLPPTISY